MHNKIKFYNTQKNRQQKQTVTCTSSFKVNILIGTIFYGIESKPLIPQMNGLYHYQNMETKPVSPSVVYMKI